MSEVAVAFPPDEATAAVIVSRLAVAGIPARIDRGLFGAYLTAQAGQISVVVDEKVAGRARKIVDERRRAR